MQQYQTQNQPSGIGGWLLFFVISSAFGTLRALGIEYLDIVDIGKTIPILKPAVDLYFCVRVFYAVIIACVLCSLWSKKVWSVSYVKKLLIINPIVVALPAILWLCMVLTVDSKIISPSYWADAYTAEEIKSFIYAVIGSGIWYWYFSVSKRVKNTF